MLDQSALRLAARECSVLGVLGYELPNELLISSTPVHGAVSEYG